MDEAEDISTTTGREMPSAAAEAGELGAEPAHALGDPPAAKPETIEPEMREPATREPIAAMEPLLVAIWRRSKGIMTDRVALLCAASDTLQRSGYLPEDQREAAVSAAHKLAGVLGTFGFPEGTEAARKIERLLDIGPITTEVGEKLYPLVTVLEKIVQK